MRPIPAPRLGDTHGLLRAINQRGRLRLDEFITEFSIEELFPPGLENALGRTRQFVSFARSAGLLNEDRGSVELTEIGKRYVRAGDDAAVFDVASDQAEWLRRQLRERHMTDSIYHGAAIGLSLYASRPPEFRVSMLDFGRALAYLGRAGWDNENTLESQGERYTTFLRDLELVDGEDRLTATGSEAKAELTLPIHMSLRDLAGQLNPGGPEAAESEGEAEWAARAAAEEPAPAVEEPAPVPAAPAEEADDGPGESGEYEDVRGGMTAPSASPAEPAPAEPAPAEPAPSAAAPAAAAPAADTAPAEPPPPAAPGRPVPPSDIWETAAPDETTRAYSTIKPEQATAASAAEPEAPDAAAMTSGDPLGAPAADVPEAEAEPAPPEPERGDPLAAPAAAEPQLAPAAPEPEPGDPLAAPAAAEPQLAPAAPQPAQGEPPAAPPGAGATPEADRPVEGPPAAVEAGEPLAAGAAAPEAGELPVPEPAQAPAPVAPEPETAAREPEPAAAAPVGVAGPGVESAAPALAADAEVADAAPAPRPSTREPSGFLDLAAVRAAAEESGLKLPGSVYAGLVAALASGKHLVISGPAGSGKSTLALAIAKAAVQAGRSAGAALATASPRWTADDTVGRMGEAGFTQGHVLAAAGKNKWLLIDELDRAELDQAFGDLSSFLGGLPLSLPDGSREVAAPADWRIVATRDVGGGAFDASSALLRRFAQVHLPRPGQADLEAAVDAAADGDATAVAAVKRLLALDLPELGAGTFLDAARHGAERNALAAVGEAELARELLAAYVAPQLHAEPGRVKELEDAL